MLFGSSFSQIITMLSSIVIARIYSPEEFGVFSNIISTSALIVPLLALSYPMALILPRRLDHSAILLNFTIFLILIIGVLLLLITNIVQLDRIFIIGNVGSVEIYIYSMLMALLEVLTFWSLRKENFKLRATALVVQALCASLLKVCLGYFYPTAVSLLYATIISLLFINLFLYCKLGISVSFKRNFLFKGWAVAKRYAHIAKYRTPQNLLVNLNQLLPIILLTKFYGSEVAGMFALSKSVLLLPGTIIANSIGDALYPKLNSIFNNGGELSGLIVKVISGLFLIGLIPLFTLIFWGPELFSFVFGKNWNSAGVYAQWLCVWLFFSFVNKPLVTLVPILGLEKTFFKNSIANSILTVTGLVSGYYFFNSDICSIAFVCTLTIIPQIVIFTVTFTKVFNYERLRKTK